MRKTFSTPTQISYINFNSLPVASVEQISVSAAAAFTVDSSRVFRDDVDITPITLTTGLQYMPWGADNQLPYHTLDMVEKSHCRSNC